MLKTKGSTRQYKLPPAKTPENVDLYADGVQEVAAIRKRPKTG